MTVSKTDEPWRLSACELSVLIRDGSLSCVEVMESVVGRIRSSNGRINAIVDDLGDEALAVARERDRQLRRGQPVGPLHGIPVTVKINVDMKGRPTSNGVPDFADLVAADDSPVVRNLVDAGAVIVGRTNTPEFSMRMVTDNPLHGRTLNPWHPARTPGGSSGGAGAGVAMGYGPVGHGNDIAGSLRIPAFACGLATVKPSLGRVPSYLPSAPEERGLLAQLMAVQGVIAREARDVRLVTEVLARRDARDPWHVPLPFRGPPVEPPLRVAVTRETWGLAIDPEIVEAVDIAARLLAESGYVVEEVAVPDVRAMAALWRSLALAEMKVMLDPMVRLHGSATVQSVFDGYYAGSDVADPLRFLREVGNRTAWARRWSLFLERYPLVLTPFQLQPTFARDIDEGGPDAIAMLLDSYIYSYAFNLIGLPAGLVCPGVDGGGLPVGVQIVGRMYREDLIVDALEFIEAGAGIPAHRLWQRLEQQTEICIDE
jgi:amidase